MCFSAEVSLTTGAVLIPVGGYAATAAWRKDRRYLPLAATPLLFGVQQLCEGGVWIGVGHDDPRLTLIASLAFLFFALAFWPAWIPLAAAAVEPPGWKRRAFAATAVVGLAVGVAGYRTAADLGRGPGDAHVVQHSLRYDFPDRVGDWVGAVWSWVYLAVACGPLVLSRDRRVRVLGFAVLAAAAVTYLLFRYAFASVWCLFAAALSAYLGYVVYRLPGKPHPSTARAGEMAS